MSGSPKYTTAVVTAAAAAALAAQAARRQEARRRAEQEARARQLARQAAQLRERLGALTRRIAALRSDASRAGLDAAAARLGATVSALVLRSNSLPDEKAVDAARREAGEAERAATRLAGQVSDALVRLDHQAALATVRATLDAVPERTAYDPDGAARTNQSLAGAANALGAAGRFQQAFSALELATAEHLETVAQRQAAMEQLRQAVAQATAAVETVIAEAVGEQVQLAGAQAARAEAARLAAELDACRSDSARAEAARRDAENLARTGAALARELDAEFARLDRTNQVVKAAMAALPEAGFRLVQDSKMREGARVLFKVSRLDDASEMHVDVNPGADGKVHIAYHGNGGDYVAEQTVDGDVKYCDVTEEMLEKLHGAMQKEGVETDGLRWDGRPNRIRKSEQTWRAQETNRRTR